MGEFYSVFTVPSSAEAADVTVDNSAGTADLTATLFASKTVARQAVILYPKGVNDAKVFIGGVGTELFELEPGRAYVIKDKVDLSKVSVRVPAGVIATFKVLYQRE